MPVPALAVANVYTGVPPNVTASPEITPDKTAVPLTVAVVVRSYSRLTPAKPVTVNALAVMLAVRLG